MEEAICVSLAAIFWMAAVVVLALERRRTRTGAIREGVDLALVGTR